jgi:uncharacterized protein
VTHQVFDDPAALAALCRRYDIRRLSLFGSTLRGTNRPDSDLDLLVEFEPGHKPGLLGLAKIQAELTTLAGGRPVDLRDCGSRGSISRRQDLIHAYFDIDRDIVWKTAVEEVPPLRLQLVALLPAA